MSEPKKLNRRKFIYAGLGVLAIAAIGSIAYFAMTPPQVTRTTSSSTTSVTTPTQSTTPSTTKSPGDTIRIWQLSYASELDKNKWENIFNKFTKETGIKVEVSSFGGSDIVAKCTNIFESGVVENFPDLISPAWAMNPLWSVRGFLEPLDDIIDWLKSNYGNKIVSGALQNAYWMGPDGQRRYYAVLTGITVGAMFWRTDILQKIGADEKDVLEHETYNTTLYKIKEYGLDKLGLLAPLSAQCSSTGSTDCTNGFYWRFTNFAGVSPIDPATLKVQLDDTQEHFNAVVQVVEEYAKLYKDGINIKSALVDAGVDNNLEFINGQVATTFNGIASIYAVLKDRKAPFLDAVRIFPVPGNSKKNVKPRGHIDPRFMLVPARLPKERLDLAKKFIKFFLTEENYKEWFGKDGGFGWYDAPIYSSMMEEEPYISHPVWKGVKDTINYGGFPCIDLWRPSFGTLRDAPPTIEIGGYILGKYQTAEEAAKAIVTRIKGLINQYDKGLP
ncbi:MAG: ABC transporter substrate-binding protein [Candidatus Micrarchaeia archaeon]